jgi:hypothetical protein
MKAGSIIMKTKTQARLLVLFAGVGLSIASAKTYHISVPEHTEMAGTQLKAGDYSLKVNGTTATLISDANHSRVEANGVVQSSDTKFIQTELEVTTGSNGINHVSSIDLGGTTTKLTFSDTAQGTK